MRRDELPVVPDGDPAGCGLRAHAQPGERLVAIT
jgi:hypothetical protein